MYIRLGCALVITLGCGIAHGQQAQSPPAHTGGTCSEHAAKCRDGCANRAMKAGGCNSLCENRRTECMQTGTFVGRSFTVTGVQKE